MYDREQTLRYRRIDRVDRGPVDPGAASGQRPAGVGVNRPRGHTPGTCRRPEKLVPEPGQLNCRRCVLVRVDAGGLYPAIPDVPVGVVTTAGRAKPRGQLQQPDGADQDQHHRGPCGCPDQQPGT